MLRTPSLGSFWSAVVEVLLPQRLFEVDVVDVRQCAEPCEHVREFIFEVTLGVSAGRGAAFAADFLQRRRQFADLLDQPHERARRPALRIRFVIPLADVLLKLPDCQGLCVAHGGDCSRLRLSPRNRVTMSPSPRVWRNWQTRWI